MLQITSECSLKERPGSNAVLHLSRTQFNQLDSCEVRRLTKLSSTDFIWSGRGVLHAWPAVNSRGPYASTTATARTTPSKKCVSILLFNFAIIWNGPLCLSVLKLASAKYATNAFSSK